MANRYVSKSGSDSYNGEYDTWIGGSNGPWLTLTWAAAHISAGQTLYIRAGTYAESVDFGSDGTADNRITIDNYPGETVVIDGEYTKPSIYESPLVTISGDYVTLQDVTITRAAGGLLFITGDYSYAINITGDGSWCSGIISMGTGDLIDDCTMTDNGNGYPAHSPTWGSAIATVGTNCTIQNCISHDNRGEGINAYSTATGCVMQDNIVYDNASYNCYIDSSDHITVRRNLVYLSSAYAPKSNGIFVGNEWANVMSDISICNNLVLGCGTNMQVATDVSNLTIAYNTFVNSTESGGGYNMGVYILGFTYSGCVFKNNIVLEEVSEMVPITVLNGTGWTFDYNCWSETPDADAVGAHDVVDDPELAKTGPTGAGELTANYFKILGTSPCIGQGIYDASYLTDYFGTVRKIGTSPNGPDIGAHEYQMQQISALLREGIRIRIE